MWDSVEIFYGLILQAKKQSKTKEGFYKTMKAIRLWMAFVESASSKDFTYKIEFDFLISFHIII